MTIFITGGCKNGKSTFALRQAIFLAGERPKYYVATMEPVDEEERERIRVHRAARAGMGFRTLEQPRDLSECLKTAGKDGVFLLDSVTALLANEMFSPSGRVYPEAAEKVERDLDTFLRQTDSAVIVSDYLYNDGGRYSPESETFRRGLARLDRFLAARCGCVVEICAGLPFIHKGALPEREDKQKWI